MKVFKVSLCAAAAPLVLVAGVAHADALSMPAMSSTLAADPMPASVDAGPLGKVFVTGVVSGLGRWQDHHVAGLDRETYGDLSNAQVFVQKTDGPLQFFVQAGAYSLPSLGTAYAHNTDSRTVDNATFGYEPQAFVKFAPSATFSIMAGKLPTLVGAEYTFSFENIDIDRGLLWNQEPAVSRGVQANYAQGPVSLSVSYTDGFYSKRYNWLTASAAFTLSPRDTLAVIGGGNLGRTPVSTFATPVAQNNGDIFNVIWTHTEGAWVFNPYVQYSHVPAKPAYGWSQSASTYGGALLVKYAFTPAWSLGARAEYIASTGSPAGGAPSLLYGPGSKAWSATLTPTYQKGVVFARAELSYTAASDVPAGFSPFGAFDKTSQTRLSGEVGFIF